MSHEFIKTQCPVCGYSVATTIYNAGIKPLALIAWETSAQAAKNVPCFKQEYIQCLKCSHIWNQNFDWNDVPYADKPNRMYNNGSSWKKHIQYLTKWLGNSISENPTIVDIGCGDGSFLANMSNYYNSRGTFLGFDPSGEVTTYKDKINFYRQLFRPLEDTGKYKPDLIVMRHIIEHLNSPSSFVHSLAWGASTYEHNSYLYCEVPCIDRIFQTGRLSDFYYEHPSQFTTRSFNKLLSTAGEIIDIYHSYDGEVICGLVKLEPNVDQRDIYNAAKQYSSKVNDSIFSIRSELNRLLEEGKSLAIWGGTGKCAAFMHHYSITLEDIPIVVDSDSRKWGTHVPGVGQLIQDPSILLDKTIDILIIPAQWRARDIIIELNKMGLKFQRILIEHKGMLVNFMSQDHPYRMP